MHVCSLWGLVQLWSRASVQQLLCTIIQGLMCCSLCLLGYVCGCVIAFIIVFVLYSLCKPRQSMVIIVYLPQVFRGEDWLSFSLKPCWWVDSSSIPCICPSGDSSSMYGWQCVTIFSWFRVVHVVLSFVAFGTFVCWHGCTLVSSYSTRSNSSSGSLLITQAWWLILCCTNTEYSIGHSPCVFTNACVFIWAWFYLLFLPTHTLQVVIFQTKFASSVVCWALCSSDVVWWGFAVPFSTTVGTGCLSSLCILTLCSLVCLAYCIHALWVVAMHCSYVVPCGFFGFN